MKCNCIEEANKALAPHGVKLDTVLSISLLGGGFTEQMYVPTVKLGAQRPRKKPPTLFANFCPICGVATGLKKREPEAA